MHPIRLRGPWQVQPTGLPARTVHVPVDWAEEFGPEFHGVARFTRHFQRPTGLDEHSRVWLVVEDEDVVQRVTLNGAELPVVGQASSLPDKNQTAAGQARCPPHAGRYDIAPLLASRNELAIDVLVLPNDPPPGELLGNVRLEIDA